MSSRAPGASQVTQPPPPHPVSPKLGDACRPGSVSLPSSLLGEQTCPRGQGRDPPLVSGVSRCQAFLCCPFPAPHSHRSPRRQQLGRARRASCDRGGGYHPGRAGPGRARQHPGPPKGASGTLSPSVFAVCGGWLDIKAGTYIMAGWEPSQSVSQPVSLFHFN